MADIELVIKMPESIWVAIQNGELAFKTMKHLDGSRVSYDKKNPRTEIVIIDGGEI